MLVVAPRPDRVTLAVDLRLPVEVLQLALLHGLGHALPGHIRPGDEYGHRDTIHSLRGEEGARRWDRLVREAFVPWFVGGQSSPDDGPVLSRSGMSALERLRFALVRDGPKLPGGRLVGIATAPITPWPHQAVVARRLVETWPYSYLLCDEVGLGKTIEGGLALRSLILSGVVKRVLITAPASLTGQWQRELAGKFFLPFALALTGAGRCHRYRRQILPIPRIVFTDQEHRAYDQLESYCRGLAQQVAGHASSRNKAAVGFLLSFLRLRFASSLFAVRETVRRRRERVQATLSAHLADAGGEPAELEAFVTGDEDAGDDEAVAALLHDRTPEDLAWEKQKLDEMLQTLANLEGTPSKLEAFLRALDQRRIEGQPGRLRQTVVFTRFLDTLTDLVRRLRYLEPNLRIGTFSGEGGEFFDPDQGVMVSVEREDVKHRFLRGEIDLLLCTDAAAEGLNLQTADLLINFDLPWNPMKVEQRIGRIDRIGQRHDEIHVLNLCYVDSVEQIVYERLLRRLAATQDIVGTQQIGLLPVTLEEFQQLADGTLNESELEQRARSRLRAFQQRASVMEIRPEDLYDIYVRLAEDGQQKPPVDLEAIWTTLAESNYLRQRGCALQERGEGQLLALAGIAGVPDGTLMTHSRTLFERGLPDQESSLRFASYGDPAFDAMLTQIDAMPLPRCVRRLSVALEGYPAEIVGYAVTCRTNGETRQARLITCWHQLQELSLDETAELSEAEVDPLCLELFQAARQEIQPRRVQWIEQHNVRAARAQQILGYLVMTSLLESHRSRVQDGDSFWAVLDDLRGVIRERPRLIVPDIPAELLRAIHSDLLFDCTVPTSGDKGRLTAPRVLLDAAADAVGRMADALRERRSEVGTDRMLQRLRREVERGLRSLQGGVA